MANLSRCFNRLHNAPQGSQGYGRKTRLASARHGFTLMEIILVLGIMVVVAAMAAPMFSGTIKQERLRKGIELIAADWVRTRAIAMQTGETQVWIGQIANGTYASSPYGESAIAGADLTGLVAGATGAVPAASTSAESGQTLPYGVTISEVLVSEADTVVQMSQTSSSGESGNAMLFFYPDGTCSSGRVTVTDEDQHSMSAVINGLAGTVRVVYGVPGATR